MHQVGTHALWIGHAGDGRAAKPLFDAGIRAVVDLAAEEAPAVLPRDLIALRFTLADGADNPPEVLYLAVNTVAGLLSWGLPTLVCCSAGMSRAPAVAAAALALWQNESAEQALTEVAGHRPVDISPVLSQAVIELFPSLR
jgi:protein-tyrosine phosphatase